MKNVTIINSQVDKISFITNARLKAVSVVDNGMSTMMDSVDRKEVKLNTIINKQSFTNEFINSQINDSYLDHIRTDFTKKVQREIDKLDKLGIDVFSNQMIPIMGYDQVFDKPYQSMTYSYLIREDQMYLYLYRNGVTTEAIAEHAEITRKEIYKKIDKIWANYR